MRALILSAGFGTRLKPFTDHIAKPAIPFLNVPIIGYPLFLAEKAGIREVMVNLHHLPQTVKNAVHSIHTELSVEFIEELPEILDSGGGVKNAERFLGRDDHFWVFNGDTNCFFNNFDFLEQMKLSHQQSDSIATILVCPFPKDKKNLGGVFVKQDNLTIDHFSREDNGLGLTPYHYIGVGIYSKRIFEFLPKDRPSNIFYDGLTKAISENETAQVLVHPETLWLETGNPFDFLDSTRICLEVLSDESSIFHGHLQEVISSQNPHWQRFFSHQNGFYLLQDPDSVVSNDTKISGFAVIGKGSTVSVQGDLKDVVVLPSAQIDTEKTLEKQIVFTTEKIPSYSGKHEK